MDFLANPIYTGKYLEVDGVPNIIWASNTSHTYPLWLSLASLLSDWPKSAFGFSPHLTKTRMHFLASPNISQMGQLVYVKIKHSETFRRSCVSSEDALIWSHLDQKSISQLKKICWKGETCEKWTQPVVDAGDHHIPQLEVSPAESRQVRTSWASLPAKGSCLAQGDAHLHWGVAHTPRLVNAGGQYELPHSATSLKSGRH